MENLSALEQRAINRVDMEGLLDCICEWVAIPSLDGEESEIQRVVAGKMRRLGLTVDEWEIDFESLSQHPAYSAEVDREHGLGVVGTLVGTGGANR